MSPAYTSTASRLQHALANALTFGNAAAGVTAMLMSGEGDPVRRSTLILFGVVCDTFDGILARRSGHPTVVGARADGFSDVVTCGIVPALLLGHQSESSHDPLVRLAPRLYMAAITWRVVKNGFPTRTSHIYEGLPVTGAGIAVAIGAHFRLPPRAMSCLTLATVAAMVSRLPVLSGEAIVRWRHVRANGYRVSPPTEPV